MKKKDKAKLIKKIKQANPNLLSVVGVLVDKPINNG